MIGEIDAGRRIRCRQGVPIARKSCEATNIHHAQRVVPRDSIVHARVPDNEDAECEKRQCCD